MKMKDDYNRDTIISATLFLMSRYAKSQDDNLINAICLHLEILENDLQTDSAILKKSCRRLRAIWLSIADKKPAQTTYLPVNIREAQDIH